MAVIKRSVGFMELQKYQKCSKVTRGLRKAEFGAVDLVNVGIAE